MTASLDFNNGLLILGGILLLSVLASKISTRLGIPSLVLFALLGMGLGPEGAGFSLSDPIFAQHMGVLALSFILFAGGLDSNWSDVKLLSWKALSLATLGTIATMAVVGIAAWKLAGFELLHGLLLGAVVASTDAAAVFSVLRARSLTLKRRLAPLLELESGSNDPMGAFLVIALVSMIQEPKASVWIWVGSFFLEMGIGLIVGAILGRVVVWLINHLRLEYDGLYPAITVAIVLVGYGGAVAIHGNGFLAVYVAGIAMARSNFLHRITLTQFHDGLGWLMQIALFLALGLMALPSRLDSVLLPGLLISAVLMFVARPVAVFLALLPSRKMAVREKLFVSWAGLRGAVPIVFATIPLTQGVSSGRYIFDLVFFVVLTSVLVQGMTIPWVAKRLGVLVDRGPEVPEQRSQSNLFEVTVPAGSRVVGKQVLDLGLPSTALLVHLKRGEGSYIPRGATVIEAGDVVTIASRKEDADHLTSLLTGEQPERA